MENSQYEKDLVLVQRFILSNHFRLLQANSNATARNIKALGGGGGGSRNCGKGNLGKGDRAGNPGYKGTITKHSTNYDDNT